MLVNPSITNDLYQYAGSERLERAKTYQLKGKVNIQKVVYENSNNFEINAIVNGNLDNYHVYINVKNAELQNLSCECADYSSHYGACKHIVATMMEFCKGKHYTTTSAVKTHSTGKEKYTDFKDLINTFYEDFENSSSLEENNVSLSQYGNVKIIPKLLYDKFSGEIKVEFKIGTTQIYKLKNLVDFYDYMLRHELFRYGAKLSFVHCEDAFCEDSRPLLHFIMKYAEIIKYVNSNSTHRFYGRALSVEYITLSNSGLDELFEILNGQEITIERDYVSESVHLLAHEPELYFDLIHSDSNEYKLLCPIETYNTYFVFYGKEFSYFLHGNILYRCSKDYENSVIKLLEVFRRNFTSEIKFSQSDLYNFFSMVVPKVEKYINTKSIDEMELEPYLPQKLGVKVFLDMDSSNNIICTMQFCYGNIEFNPIDETARVEAVRNILDETSALNLLRKTGFLIDKKNLRFILTDEEKIYNFLSEDINEYMQKFEVLASDDFKEKQIKQPKLGSLGVKLENNLLSINLENLNFDKSELQEILSKYRLKKKYHRLKDGSFFSLEENESLDFIEELMDGANIEYRDISKNEIQLPISRTLYLDNILHNLHHTPINKSSSYTQMLSNIENVDIEIPKILDGVLRPYQKTGFEWLKTLDLYNLGGILADDMGLGKTLQLISLILAYKEENLTSRKPILVVCPSSLSLNWKNEIAKFVDNIRTLVISGSADIRLAKIKDIPNYDVVITSYDLLKRDIEIYEDINYEFRYVIADEAQYMKNSNTQNAKSIKQIRAQTRFALTGTPIENSLSELWSIFDFVIPGYLFSYKKFKEKFEIPIVRDNNEQAMKRLKALIEPFVLRRTKKEVLTELPDKTITVLNNEMNEEQQKIYLAYLAQAKQELQDELLTNGFDNSRIKILALLTRLRQICCHPSLFINGYNSNSSKLEQCIDIVNSAIEAGHKILLFSNYTSMFDIIEKELKKYNIQYFKLTGQTKVNTRIELVDEFNSNPDIKVFLISLKAGGTGLNLIGADMVIHYDPWWNISAENQATDRAYRIGQKNNVQVYKLITKNSIEEKIFELQNKKSELIENVLDTNTSFINKLSKEEILSLFE